MEVDPDDRHVLAAAIVARTDVIVTKNVRHFPPATLASFDIEIQIPDEFLLGLFVSFPDALSSIIATRANDLGDTVPETLEFLRQHVPQFVAVFEAQNSF